MSHDKKMLMSSFFFSSSMKKDSFFDYSCRIQFFLMVLQSKIFCQFTSSFLIILFIRIKTSISHINSLDDAKFKKLLQRIAEKAGRQVNVLPFISIYIFFFFFKKNFVLLKNETLFTLEELNKLENAFGLSTDDIKQMIETIEYMFLQSAYHLIKPQILLNDLMNEQNFDENKVIFKIFLIN